MTDESIERRLAAILSADVAGYSRLMSEDEAGTLATLKAHRAEFIDPEVASHGGRIVKLMGDGALVEFPSVVNAVECAVAVQQGMAARNTGVPENTRIAFRIGINLGDIIVGIDGDLEHGGAMIHPKLGKPMRAAVGGGKSLISSNAKVASAGASIDLPLGHKDDA